MRHRITAWLRFHGYVYTAGAGMVFVHFPNKFREHARFFSLLDYASSQAKFSECRIYLLLDSHAPQVSLRDYFESEDFYL